jgi:hypothetical protein
MTGPVLTTNGLRTQPNTAAVSFDAQWANGGGSADAIAAVYQTPVTVLYDGLILGVRVSAANVTATPTFQPDDLPAYTIVKGAGIALDPGDLPGANYEALLRWNANNTVWELLNPYVSKRHPTFTTNTGSSDALLAIFDPPFVSFNDGQLITVRATAANTTTNPTLGVDGLTARTIYKNGQSALNIGDIPINHDALFSYHSGSPPWFELENPASAAQAGSFALAGGTVNVITATYSPAHTALVDGMQFNVRFAGPNTAAAVSFNPDTLGALQVYKKDKQPLAAYDTGLLYDGIIVYHDDTIDWFELINPMGGVQVTSLTTDDATATDVSTALAWFPLAQDTVTLSEGTEYEFEGKLRLSRSAGVNAHTTSLLFGGTAVLDYISYVATALQNDDASNAAPFMADGGAVTATVVKGSSSSATEQTLVHVKGRLKVGATGGGTLIPQFKLSAAAGGISTRKAGTFFKIAPLVTDGSWS